jgi:hypothetical protein
MNPETTTTNETRTRGLIVETVQTAPGLESAVKALMGDTTAQARAAFGEDSVTRTTLTVTHTTVDVATGAVVASGTFGGEVETQVGAAYEAAHPQAIPQNAKDALMGALLGALRPAVMAQVDDVMTAMTDGSMTLEEGTAVLMTALNVTPEARQRGVDALKARRALSVRTRSAPVRVRRVD